MPLFPEQSKDPMLTDETGIPIYDENGYSFYGDYDLAPGVDWNGILAVVFLVIFIISAVIAG